MKQKGKKEGFAQCCVEWGNSEKESNEPEGWSEECYWV